MEVVMINMILKYIFIFVLVCVLGFIFNEIFEIKMEVIKLQDQVELIKQKTKV